MFFNDCVEKITNGVLRFWKIILKLDFKIDS